MSIEIITEVIRLLELETTVLATEFKNVSDNTERTEQQVHAVRKRCELITGLMQGKYDYLNSLISKCRSEKAYGEIYVPGDRLRNILVVR